MKILHFITRNGLILHLIEEGLNCLLFIAWDEIYAYLSKKQGEIKRTLTIPIPLIGVITSAKTH